MASHGVFGQERQRGGRGGSFRRVNFNDQHDDRDQGSSGHDYNRRGNHDSRGGYNNRGNRGSSGGRWTRGGRGRGGQNNYRSSGGDYGGDREKRRYTPYNPRGRSQRGGNDSRGGNKKGSVFSRLGMGGEGEGGGGGGQDNKRGGVFGRLSGLSDDGNNQGNQSWHKIMIIGGGEGNHDGIIADLQSQIQEPFQAQQIHAKGDKLMFFIEEHRAANELKQLRDPSVIVKPSPPPRQGNREGGFNSRGGSRGRGGERGGGGRGGWTERVPLQRGDSDFMEEDCTEVLLQVLGDRFDSINMSLDLSNVFHDRRLQEHNIRGSMYDANFVNSVLELISAHCPNLNSLDLSKNRLQRLDLYSALKEKCPNLQILDLSDNRLSHVNTLEGLGQLTSVTTLVLENNPLLEFHSDFASYAAGIRKYFPSLQVLDGQQLPSPVRFDLPSSSGSLPLPEKGYLVNEEVKSFVVSFLEQYYTIYDSETRDKLLEAYSDNAVFSMSVNIAPHQLKNNPYPNSRNLARINEAGKRSSLIKRGRIDIVQLLRNLPRSYHLAATFNVDVMRASPVNTAFTVHGIFSEAATGPKSDFFPIRAFTRTFIVVATGNGVAIANDQLSIRGASSQAVQQHQDNVKQHFSPGLSQGFPSSSGLSVGSPPFPSSQPFQAPSTLVPQANPQEVAATRLSLATRMNIEWSKKCLAENGWDFEKALTAFNILNSQGSIPPEAFSQLM